MAKQTVSLNIEVQPQTARMAKRVSAKLGKGLSPMCCKALRWFFTINDDAQLETFFKSLPKRSRGRRPA